MMQKNKRGFSIALILVFLAGAAFAQGQIKQTKQQPVAPAGASNPVVGSGTPGQITKWLGSNGFSFTIGDSNITEDKFGKVGIGTTNPTSLLTVQGMIETTLGGIKFPDGTSQTTSAAGALFGVAHDATPEEKSIEWARHPEMMQRLQQRLEVEEKIKKQQQR